MTEPVRIELFDGLRVAAGGSVITRFRTQKTAALLAYLAYTLPRRHSREALIELVWPEFEAGAGRHNLSNAVSSLRVQLEAAGVAAGIVLAADRNTVGLNAEHVTTDVAEFQQRLEEARAARTPPERAQALAAAVRLYRGELLRGHYEEWIFPEQARMTVTHLRALKELTTYHEAAGELDAAIDFATRAVSADPLCEESRYRLMVIYAAAGQSPVALDHYRELRRLMRRELDAAPCPEIEELARRLAGSRPSSAPPTSPPLSVPTGMAPVPSGRHAVGPAEPDGELSLETVDGAVPLHSRFYIERATDVDFERSIGLGESIILIKGARQTGKTSLLARGLQVARGRGARVVLTDLQTLAPEQLASADAVLFALAESLADQLDLDVRPRSVWDPDRGPALNIRRYLRREVLGPVHVPIVWALDEVDRLLGRAAGGQVFALFRSWHNERALEPGGPWLRLTLAMAYAAEADLLISDLSQSPFNVGVRLELQDFTREQVADLNARYGSPLSDLDLQEYFALVGGHPYLVRRGLREMVRRGVGLSALTDLCDAEVGAFADPIHRLVRSLSHDPRLVTAVRSVLEGGGCPDQESFHRLRSAGVISGESASRPRMRCRLYEQVLRQHLT